MADGVSVESAAIKSGIKCCSTSITELKSASSKLKKSYQTAGSGGWKDKKYAALGDIVEDCYGALTKPVSDLEDCKKKLEELLIAVNAYEQVNL